ncbi:MAG: GNAT family N-acetyltransferase [Bradyrhizobium sp.]|uniref:GNAT family N-acetyltransferase n=1 Tax=Bradyrhizobium sp. TaxID=376 RepID=UPI001ED4C20D|nr:GNAT family N-acetyltransferase [Bradyrhizobium sp.]MBU6457687.1 GNAT family N-acetyltransferase [Bradyrhizobium sp.]MDE2603897.1 GNAT family N-acetyltransferase [Bradyrhizobium sp.]
MSAIGPSVSSVRRESFSISIVSRAELSGCAPWTSTFADQRKDYRYYEILDDTLRGDFEYRYFTIVDNNGRVRAIQPFFLVDQDILQGLGVERIHWISLIRRFHPRFLKLRTLMVGCSAGEAHLAATENLPVDTVAETLSNGIIKQARSLDAQLIMLKEFPSRYRRVLHCFLQRGFARAPSMPMTMLDIGYDSFDAYMTKALRSSTRKKLRKNLDATAGISDIRMSVTDDATSFVDEIYPLYLQVFERSRMRFEKLTKDFFRQLGQRMNDKVRFFTWRRGNMLVAFSLCMVQGDSLYAEYVGFDYTVALDLHLYHYVVRDMISWGISRGYKWFRSSGLNYDPKLHMGHRLDPIDLYVRHTSTLANAIFRLALPWIVPVRYDATLKLFPNYKELW